MKKTVLFLLSLIFIFTAACASSEQGEDFTLDLITDDKVDLEGTHFIFMTSWTMEYLPEAGRNLSSDKVRQRYAEVEEALNCDYEVRFSDQTIHYLTTSIASATEVPDVVQLHASEIYPFYKQGVLLALEDIATIDSTDVKWGYKDYVQYGVFNGLTYGFFPNHWLIMPEVTGVLAFNNETLALSGMSKYPYELQEQGKWTWDEFTPLLEEFTTTVGDTKTYGLGYDDVIFFSKSAIFSNGGDILKQNTDGSYSYALADNNSLQALEYISELEKNGYLKNGDYSIFTDSTVTFWHCDSWKATIDYEGHDLYPMFTMNDFGIIDFPYGPEGDTSRSNAFIHLNRKLSWPIAMSDNDSDTIGIILDYVFEPLTDMGEFAWMSFSESNIFHHEEGYQNFKFMVETARYDYSVQLTGSMSKINSAFSGILNGRETAYSALSALDEAVNEDILENMSK